MLFPMPRAKKPRKSPESPTLPKSFDVDRLRTRRSTYARSIGSLSGTWTRDTIATAIDAHLRGSFRSSVLLWRAMRREPAIFAAALNRLAPHRGLRRTVSEPDGSAPFEGTPRSILEEARACFASATSVALRPGVLAGTFEHMGVLGLSVDQVVWSSRDDGSREDPILEPWPMEAVDWSEHDRLLVATTTEGRRPIVHGDGRWVVTQQHTEEPWTWGSIVPFATIWPSLATGRRDRNLHMQSHGDDKFIGTLPEGVALDSAEGEAMLDEMEALYDFRRAMLVPNGGKVERNQSNSQAWQIFKEALGDDAKDAQRIAIGQDGTMTNTGGNYVKAWGLFGVRNDFIEADLSTVGGSMSTGLLRPWSIVNFGRWDRLDFKWLLPDADEDARLESIGKRRDAFNRAVKELRDNGFRLEQEDVNKLAAEYRIDAPTLAEPVASPNDAAAVPPALPDSAAVSIHRRPLRAAT